MDPIKKLQKTDVRKIVEERLKEFESFNGRDSNEWFSELCFCILTANSKASTALEIQAELGGEGFIRKDKEELIDCIKRNKHRFHNNKATYICCAREHIDIKDKITNIIKNDGERRGREWLVKNIKGLGYKEASHFLRNVGYNNLAILDRHILNLMVEWNMIEDKPKTLTKNVYLKIEKMLYIEAKKLKMSLAELDLYMWYLKVGKVLK